jgi:hypothetical protein
MNDLRPGMSMYGIGSGVPATFRLSNPQKQDKLVATEDHKMEKMVVEEIIDGKQEETQVYDIEFLLI